MLADRTTRVRRYVLVAALTVMLTACGSDEDRSVSDTSAASTAPATSAATAGPATTAGSATAPGGCPLSVDALSTATSLRWELRERRENQPLETNESIRATVCVFTAAAAQQSGGDPLVFRTDVVTGSDAATVRREFDETCQSLSGVTRPAGGGSVCDRNGVVVEGIKGQGDRVVAASFVNADTSTASSLTPAFPRILDATR
jgi:hypothetical protein